MPGRRTLIAATAAFALLRAAPPRKAIRTAPIEMIVPSTPGSSADILGRVLTEEMAGMLGQRFVIYNKPGAGGVLGTAEAARAKPDGYMLMHGAAFSVTVQPMTERNAGYSLHSFEPICQTFKNDQVIVARPGTYKNARRDRRREQSQAGRIELRQSGARHHPASGDGRVRADHQGRVQPRAVQGTGRVDPDDHRRADRLCGGAADRGGEQRARDAGAVCGKAQSLDPRRADREGAGLRRLAAQHRRHVRAGGPAGRRSRPSWNATCKAAVQSEPFQRIVKRTLQPARLFPGQRRLCRQSGEGRGGQAASC